MIKKVLWILLIGFIILLLINYKLVSYGYQQAKGQLSIIWAAKDVTGVLNDPTIQDSIKQKIQIVQEAKEFAFTKLRLKKSKNYTTFYNEKGEVSLWNLSASKPFALEPKLWSFPLLGSFPYKGFFEVELAKREFEKLKEEGYDARIRPVGGWSTLGWTTDPILSNMLDRSEGSLAELIIHELTHSTIFIKDDIKFNENLASFIGEKGAILFLNDKYGENSGPYFEYILAEEDSKVFRNQMLIATGRLDSLYQSFDKDLPDSIKSAQKHIMMDKIISSIDTLHFHNPRYYKAFQKTRPNNAFFMSYLRYYSSNDSLDQILLDQYQGDLPAFIQGMIDYHE